MMFPYDKADDDPEDDEPTMDLSDAAPAPTEDATCPSGCGRNEPCPDRWHDDGVGLMDPRNRP